MIKSDPLLSAQIYLTALEQEGKRGSPRRTFITLLHRDVPFLQHVLLGAHALAAGKTVGGRFAAALEESAKPPNQDAVGIHATDSLFVITDGYQEEGHWFSLLLQRVVHEHPNDPPQTWVQECARRGRDLAIGPFSGACFVALKLTRAEARVSWLGDSKLFHVRGGAILYHTAEHTVAEDAIREGRATPPQLWNARDHHVVTRSVHALCDDPPEEHTLQLTTGDWLILCSDGISDNLKTLEGEQYSYRRIADLVSHAISADAARDALMKEVKHHIASHVRGDPKLADSKPDNLSLIVIKVG